MNEGGEELAYNEEFDARVTGVVAVWGTTRKQMCGVHRDYLIVRLEKARSFAEGLPTK